MSAGYRGTRIGECGLEGCGAFVPRTEDSVANAKHAALMLSAHYVTWSDGVWFVRRNRNGRLLDQGTCEEE